MRIHSGGAWRPAARAGALPSLGGAIKRNKVDQKVLLSMVMTTDVIKIVISQIVILDRVIDAWGEGVPEFHVNMA